MLFQPGEDNILMLIRGQGLVEGDQVQPENTDQRVVYVLHPNCAIEEM